MRPEFTVKDLAGRLAEATDTPASALARQIRHWAQNGLFADVKKGPATKGETTAVIYSESHLAAARIFLFLSNMNWHIKQLADVSRCLRNIASEDAVRDEGAGFRHLWESGLDAVVDAAKRGDRDWVFSIYLTDAGHIQGGLFSRAPHDSEIFEGLGRAKFTLPIGVMLSKLFAPSPVTDSSTLIKPRSRPKQRRSIRGSKEPYGG